MKKILYGLKSDSNIFFLFAREMINLFEINFLNNLYIRDSFFEFLLKEKSDFFLKITFACNVKVRFKEDGAFALIAILFNVVDLKHSPLIHVFILNGRSLEIRYESESIRAIFNYFDAELLIH